MTTDKEFLDWLHTEVHAIRLKTDYKPTDFELKLVMKITDKYADSCMECKEKAIQYKYNPPQIKKGFLGGLFK